MMTLQVRSRHVDLLSELRLIPINNIGLVADMLEAEQQGLSQLVRTGSLYGQLSRFRGLNNGINFELTTNPVKHGAIVAKWPSYAELQLRERS